MKRYRILFIISLFPALLWARTYTPQEVPNPKAAGQQHYVANPDNILNEENVEFLNRGAKLLEDSAQVELAVVAVESIGDQDMFDFTYRLFQLWGIGKQGKNTGVLICFVLSSHDIRIMTGQGIEGVLPDAICKRIIDEDMIPFFRQEKYGEGICWGVLHICELCWESSAELLNVKSATRRSASQSQFVFDETMEDLIVWGTILGVIALVIVLTWCVSYRRKKCPKCGKHTCRTRTQTLVAATYSATGIGLSTRTCAHCGYTSQHRFTIPRLTRTTTYRGGGFGSGGFGGGFSSGSFGGGSTMGGGAGGKW